MNLTDTFKSVGALAGITAVMLYSGWIKQCIRQKLFGNCKIDEA